MPEPLPALLFSNPVSGEGGVIGTQSHFVIQGRVNSNKGVLPYDLVLVGVSGTGVPASQFTRPVSSDVKGDPGGDPWFLAASASDGVANGARIVVWGRRVTPREARQNTGWAVGVTGGPRNDTRYGRIYVVRFAGGWYRWPQPFRFSQFVGTTSSASYRWAPVNTFDASADSIITRPGQFPGEGLSTTLVFTSGRDDFTGSIVAPFTGSGLKRGPTGMHAEYCRHDGEIISGGRVTGIEGSTNPYDSALANERYVSLTLSIAPTPNVTFPTGDRPVRQIGQSFAANLDGFTVSGAGSARIE